WSPLIDIKPAGTEDDLFVFDMQMDRPPTYRTHASVAAENSRYIDSKELVAELTAVIAGKPAADFFVPNNLPDNLLVHLQQAWGALAEPSFRRVGQPGPVDICLALSMLHSPRSGGMDFDTMTRGSELQILEQGPSKHLFLAARPKTVDPK